MAHLLGSPACMDSLRADITDLQGAIADVSSRAGAVRYPSWKFPDKVSCELDLVELLERYDYVENDLEFTQHSHVVLLELVIDRRLLLLLQSFTGYTENLLSEKAIPPARPVGPCMSAGLTVRKYWNSMLKLGALYQQLLTEKKTCRKDIPTLKSTPEGVKTEKECLKSCSPTVSELTSSIDVAQPTSSCLLQSVSVPDCDISGSSLPRSVCSITESSRNIPTQTTESSLVPCDSCAGAQASLREVSKAITSICQSQNIPSALSRFHETLEETMGRRTLSAMDMSYWASEQSKDLSRISKHLHMLLELINPLKLKLEEAEKQKDELRKQAEEFAKLLQEEKKTQEQQKEEAEQTLEAKKKEYLETVAKLERDKEDLRRGTPGLKVLCLPTEVTKKTLLEDMRTKMVAKSQVLELEEKVQLLTGQQEGMGQELSAITTQLEKEKAKVESMLRHEESLQAKQRTLLQQLDSLDQECEELRASLGEAEEDKARLAEQLKESQDKWEQSGCQLEAQQLHTNISGLEELVRELKERERLLVFFPELHVPVETQFESTGNITEDMEKQLQANNIRLSILEQENRRLRAALAKVKAAAQQGALK
ncbi:CC157 protein, partial [Dromaius novaehollandiae]|nr:CC157 protein [Dromaius novaehollandiae]